MAWSKWEVQPQQKHCRRHTYVCTLNEWRKLTPSKLESNWIASVHAYLTQFQPPISQNPLANPTNCHTKGNSLHSTPIYINPTKIHHISKAPKFLHMAKSSSVSFTLVLVLVVCLIPALEARKVPSLEKRKVSSMEESLDLALLPKAPPPPSSPSDNAYVMVNSNGRVFTLQLPSVNDEITLPAEQSHPSPGVGHDGHN